MVSLGRHIRCQASLPRLRTRRVKAPGFPRAYQNACQKEGLPPSLSHIGVGGAAVPSELCERVVGPMLPQARSCRGPVPLSTSKKPSPSVDKSHFCSEKSWHQRRKSARRALNRGGCSWGVLLSDPRRPPEVHLASSTRATLCECCVEGAGAALNVVQAWGLE